MRLPVLPSSPAGAHELPLWPPLLATRGRGSKSEPHSHHAMHLMLALDGVLKVRAPRTFRRMFGVAPSELRPQRTA